MIWMITVCGKDQAEYDENVYKFLRAMKKYKLTINKNKRKIYLMQRSHFYCICFAFSNWCFLLYILFATRLFHSASPPLLLQSLSVFLSAARFTLSYQINKIVFTLFYFIFFNLTIINSNHTITLITNVVEFSRFSSSVSQWHNDTMAQWHNETKKKHNFLSFLYKPVN